MAGVEEMEVRTGIKGIMNDVRKEKKGGHHYNAGYMRLNLVGLKKATK